VDKKEASYKQIIWRKFTQTTLELQ